MMRKIVRRSILINALEVVVLIVGVSGCGTSSRSKLSLESSIVTVEGVFARERYEATEFSLCNSGFDDGVRIHPLLIDIDTSDLMSSYTESVVYAPMYGKLVDSFIEANVHYQDPWDVEADLDSASRIAKNVRVPANYRMVAAVNDLISKYFLNLAFSGFYEYDLLKVRMRCYPAQTFNYQLLNIGLQDMADGVFVEVQCSVMQIVEIVKIEPVQVW